jgi:hypothetical protein
LQKAFANFYNPFRVERTVGGVIGPGLMLRINPGLSAVTLSG